MDVQRIAAILLIANFVIMAIVLPVPIPDFYQTQDIGERVQLVAQYHTRWVFQKSLFYIWCVVSAAGAGILAIYLSADGAPITALLGAVALALGSVAYALVNYYQQTDLVGYFEGRFPDYHVYGNWIALVGLLLLGTALLQAGLPAWLAYLLIGAAAASAVALLIRPAIFFMIPGVEVVLLLVIGIVLLRR